MKKLLGEMSLDTLAEYSQREIRKYRNKEPGDDAYILEIFRRAVIMKNDAAWAVLREQFRENLHLWISRHPARDVALHIEDEQSYIDDAFRRFWQAVSEQKLTFSALADALSYLRLCLYCSITDTLRAYSRVKEEVISDYDQSTWEEPSIEDRYDEYDFWETIQNILPGEKERRVAYLHFHCNLKPREIMRYCSGEFSGEEEIYRLKRNITERILRNADKIRWKLSESNYAKNEIYSPVDKPVPKEQTTFSLFAVAKAAVEKDNLSVSNTVDFLFFDILLHASDNIELKTGWYQSLRYNLRNTDPQLVTFSFLITAPGDSFLVIDIYYGRRWIRTTRLEFKAVEGIALQSVPAEG